MRTLLRRIWYVLTHRRRQAELAEEMEFHRELKERELRERGVADGSDAAYRVRRSMGNVALARDEARDVWLSPRLQSIWQDVRFAARVLAKDMRFTVTAVLALALGLAVNTTIFGIINTAILRDLPFDEPDQLVSVGTRDSRGRNGGLSFQDFNDWRSASTAIRMAAYTGAAVNLSDDSQAPERVRGGAFVSSNTFGLLRVQPIAGRDFVEEDDRPGATPVVILGYGLWQRRYGGDRSVVGTTIRVNDVPSVVVGIMPAHFGFPFSGDVWQPLTLATAIREASRDRRVLQVFGRLAEGKRMEQARAELETVAAQAAAEYPETNRDVTSRVEGMSESRVTSFMPILMTLMAFVLFVLLIACANVANLFLARSVSRSREIAIRASLGATRWRIVRQLLIECGMLTLVAGALGLWLSVYGIDYLGQAFAGREIGAPAASAVMPYWVNLSINEVVFVFVGALCVFATLLAGLAPALHVARGNTNGLLKEGGRAGASLRARRWTGGFVVAQIALTIVLLTGAGLMLRRFVTLYRTDRVVDTSHLVTARLSLPEQRYSTPESRSRFAEQLTERISSSSMSAGFTMTTAIPFHPPPSRRQLSLDSWRGSPDDELPSVAFIQVDARYFDVLGIRLTRGRPFLPADAGTIRQDVVINQRVAEVFFAGRDPLGHQIRLAGSPKGQAAEVHTIVGVAPTIPQNLGMQGEESLPVVFASLAGPSAPSGFSLIVRSSSEIAATVSQLREEVRAIDPDLPVYYAQTLDDAFAEARYGVRIIGGWFGALAVIAMALAAVGLFALTGHAVAQRTQEIGVRIALGARNSEVMWLFLRRTLVRLALGTAIGLAGALAVGQLLQTFIGRTDPRDPLTLVLVTLLIALVAVAATLLPALRATRIDPIIALRYE